VTADADDINKKTVGGLMAFCDWLKDKGYQGASATDSWKSAAKKVFETVEPESYESLELDDIDLDDYISRFQTMAGSKYRAETVTVYRRRIMNAIDAQGYYLEHGRPPSFKRGTPRKKSEGSAASESRTNPAAKSAPRAAEVPADMWDLHYPLSTGQMVHMRLPKTMKQVDVDRLSAVLRTLQAEEQRQIPEKTGEDEDQIAA
jgi:hypothetical protein